MSSQDDLRRILTVGSDAKTRVGVRNGAAIIRQEARFVKHKDATLRAATAKNRARTLEAQTITEQQVASLQEFAEQVTDRINVAAADFASKRRVIELLDVRVVLAPEDGQKVIYTSCGLGSGRVPPESRSTKGVVGKLADCKVGSASRRLKSCA